MERGESFTPIVDLLVTTPTRAERNKPTQLCNRIFAGDNTGKGEAKTISVVDVNGKVLQQTVTSNNNYSFNIKQLGAGIYFVRINDDKKGNVLKNSW